MASVLTVTRMTDRVPAESSTTSSAAAASTPAGAATAPPPALPRLAPLDRFLGRIGNRDF